MRATPFWVLGLGLFCVTLFTALEARADDAEATAKPPVPVNDEGTDNKVHSLPRKLFKKIVRDNNGDPEKIKEVLNAAAKDPKAFVDTQIEKKDSN